MSVPNLNRANSGRFQGYNGAPIQRSNSGRINSASPTARPRSSSPNRVASTGFTSSQPPKANDLMRPTTTSFSQAKAPANIPNSPHSSIQRSQSPGVGMRPDVEAANFRANVNAYSQMRNSRPISGAGVGSKRFDPLRAQMEGGRPDAL